MTTLPTLATPMGWAQSPIHPPFALNLSKGMAASRLPPFALSLSKGMVTSRFPPFALSLSKGLSASNAR